MYRRAWAVEDRLAEDGVLVWAVPLPGARKCDLDLIRRGDELLLTAARTAGSFRCRRPSGAAPSRARP